MDEISPKNESKTEKVDIVKNDDTADSPSNELEGKKRDNKVIKDKHKLAKTRIESAAQKIQSTDEEIEECLKNIENDLADYNQLEQIFVENTLKTSQNYLKELGASERVLDRAPELIVDLDDPEVKLVEIKKISSGRFKGFMLGLLGGLAALGGWCYTAAQALGLPLLPEKFPDIDRINKVLEWTSQQIGQGPNANIGAGVVVFGFVVVVFVIYWLTKTITASSNLKTAAKIEEATEFYCTKKSECKEQMAKVREHIAHAKKLLRKYEVLLDELNAKIRRALFIEDAHKYDELHSKTQEDIKKLKKLSLEVEKFIEAPMAQYGKISDEGKAAFEHANKVANDYVMEMYG